MEQRAEWGALFSCYIVLHIRLTCACANICLLSFCSCVLGSLRSLQIRRPRTSALGAPLPSGCDAASERCDSDESDEDAGDKEQMATPTSVVDDQEEVQVAAAEAAAARGESVDGAAAAEAAEDGVAAGPIAESSGNPEADAIAAAETGEQLAGRRPLSETLVKRKRHYASMDHQAKHLPAHLRDIWQGMRGQEIKQHIESLWLENSKDLSTALEVYKERRRAASSDHSNLLPQYVLRKQRAD